MLTLPSELSSRLEQGGLVKPGEQCSLVAIIAQYLSALWSGGSRWLDAALYEAAPERKSGKVGRPRKSRSGFSGSGHSLKGLFGDERSVHTPILRQLRQLRPIRPTLRHTLPSS